jgi:formylmethanofuran dehydrogenase subunit E
MDIDMKNMNEDFKMTADFHGHVCPGLAIGYRIAKYIKGHYPRSEDEELVCIADNSSCSVDAIQYMLGCTSGKGNLVFRDYGKQSFTFYSRDKGKALRIYFKGEMPARMNKLRDGFIKGTLTDAEKKEFEAIREGMMKKILESSEEEIMEIKEVDIPEPDKARIYPSIKCQECGEVFMEIKGRTACDKILCEECFKKLIA